MSHTVTYNSETHIIETKAQGNITLNEVKEIISKVIQIAEENNCFLCLGDYREANLNLSTAQIYDVPKIISDESTSREIRPYALKRAIVIKNDLEDFRFFEIVTANSRQRAKLFLDIDEAKKWLLDK